MKNPAAKSRKADNPYVTLKMGGWVWKVLRFWQADGSKPYGRAFCVVSSPFTMGSGDMGDVYLYDLQDAIGRGAEIYADPCLSDDQVLHLLGIKAGTTLHSILTKRHVS